MQNPKIEQMKMVSAGFDSVLEVLQTLDNQPRLPFPLKDRILNCHFYLRFVKLFSRFIIKNPSIDTRFEFRPRPRRSIRSIIEYDLAASVLLEEYVRTDEECENFASAALITLNNLKTIILEVIYGICLTGQIDQISSGLIDQIRVFEEKLRFIEDLFDFGTKRCSDQPKLEEFWSFMQAVINYAACLSLLDWIDNNIGWLRLRNIEEVFRSGNQVLCLRSGAQVFQSGAYDWLSLFGSKNGSKSGIHIRMLRKLGRLRPSWSPLYEKSEISELVMTLCDLLLQDLVTPIMNRFEVFRDGLVFLTAFLMNPPEKPETEAGDVLLKGMVDIISDVASSICAIYMADMEMRIPPESERSLLRLQSKIDEVMAEIREIYVPIPGISGSNFPVIDKIGFIDSLLGCIDQIVDFRGSNIRFAVGKIQSIKEDLQSIREFLKDVTKMKKDQQEVKGLQQRIINVAYYSELAMGSCLIARIPVWYNVLSVSNVAEEIKVIRSEVQKITDLEMCEGRNPEEKYLSGPLLPRRANTSQTEEVFVGFKDEMETIINRLTRGTNELDIVSIVGMPGQGKTTLAKKLYNHPAVKYHFHKCSWCCVSQAYQTKDLLLEILTNVTGHDDVTFCPKADEDELVEVVWRSLKGRRFLIIMDDIWDIGAWNGLKRSLPDDNNGSRIVFTSRIHDLVLQAKPKCNPHCIRLLNDEESWELLRERLSYNENCSSDLSEIGNKIARHCKGLPLAIVLVAGILSRKERNLDCWKEIMQTIGSYLVSEGCMDLIELSYMHLPDPLKPCFLYFGAFPEDEIIRVWKLIQLWTAEGFVLKNDVKELEDTAKEYLMDLIGRSLVTVADRSSNGEVKSCRVHDLLHDFCLTKAREERFLHQVHASDISVDSPESYEQYRLCIFDVNGCNWEQLIDSRPADCYVRSLLLSCAYKKLGAGADSRFTSFFLRFKFLHVLDMECIYIGGSFPQEITSMFHLRYLVVSGYANYLPSSIANLWNLQTLIISSDAQSCTMPDAIWSMKTLRHLHIPKSTFQHCSTDEFCQLHQLTTFSSPILTYGNDTEDLFRRLPQLRKLKCRFREIEFGSKDPIQFSALNYLSQLESLNMSHDWDWSDIDEENINRFPSFDLPNTLKKLTLCNFFLTRRAISSIGKLPNLQVLKLRNSYFLNRRWDLEDGDFLNLKYLELTKVKLRSWNDCNEPFPRLESLVLKFCHILRDIPPSFGNILTLKRMNVEYCPQAAFSARRIVEEQQDMGNDEIEFTSVDS